MDRWGLPPKIAREALETTLAALVDALQSAAEQLGSLLDPALVDGTLAHIEQMRGSADA